MIGFDVCFERAMKSEGGYVFNSNDPGGETRWGISKRSYPAVDIKSLTREGAKAIYFRDFWTPCCVEVADALKFQLFDAAVNHGIGNAIRMLQKAVGVADDGHWGPFSMAAYSKMELYDAAMLFLAERLDFMRKLNKFQFFGSGWVGRIAADLRYAAQDI